MTDLLLVEKVAEALWQADSERAAGRRRLISWADENENVCDSWRQLATAAIATMEAHRPPVTVASLYGYEAGLVEGARLMREAAAIAARDALVDYEWPPEDGDAQIDAVMDGIRALDPTTIANKVDGKAGESG